MTIEFLPLRQALEERRRELDEAFDRVLRSGWLILGREVEAFEQEFAAYCGASHCVTVGNGLDALAISLRAQGIGPGDEVIVPGHTFIASWLAVTQIGAVPVPADVDPASCNIDPGSVASAVTPRTAAIMPVHLYGYPAAMDEINRLAARYGLFVLEDAAQAHGAVYRGRRAGSLGQAAGFSFYPTKNLAALGDGGAIVTSDAGLAERARRYRNYGSSGKYEHAAEGANSRLDELQAAFLRARLGHLDADNLRRRTVAAAYRDRLAGVAGLELPPEEDGAEQRLSPVRRALAASRCASRASRRTRYRYNGALPAAAAPAARFCRSRLAYTAAGDRGACLRGPVAAAVALDERGASRTRRRRRQGKPPRDADYPRTTRPVTAACRLTGSP